MIRRVESKRFKNQRAFFDFRVEFVLWGIGNEE